VPFSARILLGPFKKYIMYGVFPWSLFLHTVLVLLASYQLLQTNDQIKNYQRAEQDALDKQFITTDRDFDDLVPIWIKPYYQLSDMIE
jgi:hypothetical protein